MRRLPGCAILLALCATPAWSQSLPLTYAEPAREARSFALPRLDEAAPTRLPRGRIVAGTAVAPNAIVGFGKFGLRREKSELPRAVGREFFVPKTRHHGVGLSLRF